MKCTVLAGDMELWTYNGLDYFQILKIILINDVADSDIYNPVFISLPCSHDWLICSFLGNRDLCGKKTSIACKDESGGPSNSPPPLSGTWIYGKQRWLLLLNVSVSYH